MDMNKLRLFLVISIALFLVGCSTKQYELPMDGDKDNDVNVESLSGIYFKSEYNFTIEKSTDTFIYYYDLKSETSVPLCSNINCMHMDSSCEASFSETECAGGMFFNYNNQLLMIERKQESDVLVEYDGQGRNKKEIATISEGKKIVGFNSLIDKDTAILYKNYFYFLRQDTSVSKDNKTKIEICRISLTNKNIEIIETIDIREDQKPKSKLKFQTFDNKLFLYVSERGITQTSNYGIRERIYSLNMDEKDCRMIYSGNYSEIQTQLQANIINWGLFTFIDKDENIWFISRDYGSDDKMVLNKYNIDKKENTIIYEFSSNDTEKLNISSIFLVGLDSENVFLKHTYFPHGKDVPSEKISLMSLSHEGKLNNEIAFAENSEWLTSKSIQATGGGDFNLINNENKLLLLSFNEPWVKGLEMSDDAYTKIRNIKKNGTIKKSIVASIDKQEIKTPNSVVSVKKILE